MIKKYNSYISAKFLKNKEMIKYFVGVVGWDLHLNDITDIFKIWVFLSFVKTKISIDSLLSTVIDQYIMDHLRPHVDKIDKLLGLKEEGLPYLLKKYIGGELELNTLQLSNAEGKILKKRVTWKNIKELIDWVPSKITFEIK